MVDKTIMLKYKPNHIPLSERITNITLSIALFTYSTNSLLTNDFYFPGRNSGGRHYHGESVWILYAAFICGVFNLLSVIIDHYDKRNNVKRYKLFARITQFSGWTLLIMGIVLDAFIFDKATK